MIPKVSIKKYSNIAEIIQTSQIIETYHDDVGNHYVKFSNGLIIQWLRISSSMIAINNSYGASLYQGTYTWNFVIPFVNYQPSVTCSQFQWGTSASFGGVVTAAPTYALLRGFDLFSRGTGETTNISAIAIGWWK